MGLDMFLTAKRFLWFNEDSLKNSIKHLLPDAPGMPSYIEVEVCYWRKANQIHQWFVRNAQEGVDDGGNYHVHKEQLILLITICKEVLADPSLAVTKLPTQSGFFFGSIEYGANYFADLKHTIKTLEPICNNMKIYDNWDFSYHASW